MISIRVHLWTGPDSTGPFALQDATLFIFHREGRRVTLGNDESIFSGIRAHTLNMFVLVPLLPMVIPSPKADCMHLFAKRYKEEEARTKNKNCRKLWECWVIWRDLFESVRN